MYDFRWKFVEGWAEVENAPHVRNPPTSLTADKIGIVQDIIEGADYYCQLLDEINYVYLQEKT